MKRANLAKIMLAEQACCVLHWQGRAAVCCCGPLSRSWIREL